MDSRLALREAQLRQSPSWSRRAAAGFSWAGPADLPPWEGYVRQVEASPVCLEIRTRSRFLNAVSIEVGDGDISEISDLSCVSLVRPVAVSTFRFHPCSPLNGPCQGATDVQLHQIGLDELHSRGWLGDGVTVGILDTGFNLCHQAFDHTEILEMYDFVNDDPDPSQQPEDPPGQSDHGTAVLSVMGGFVQGEFSGGVPDASFILAKTEDTSDEYQAEEDYWVQGLEWIESEGGELVNSSLGYIDWYQYSDLDGNTAVTTIAADAAAARGLVVYNAMGNEGPAQGTLIAPADGDSVFASGAVQSCGEIAEFSSRGPTADGRIKPDGCAMGQGVTLAYQGTSGYSLGDGTSFASPLVASAAAAVAGAHPEWNMLQVMDVLKTTASMSETPDNDYGHGIVDAYSALKYGSVTGIVMSSDSFDPLPDYPICVVMDDSAFVTSTNGAGWFAVCPGEYGTYSILSSGGEGYLIPVSGTLGVEGVEVEVYVDQDPGSYPPSVYPSPSTGDVYVGFDVSQGPVDVEMNIYDLTGQLVHRSTRRGAAAGSYRAPVQGEAFHWDGKDPDGDPAASGIYIVSLKVGNSVQLLKFTLIR